MHDTDPAVALDLARSELAIELPRRFAHVVGVGEQGEMLGRRLDGVDGDLIAAAGYLHDIGYASALKETGFHPIDGARFLQGVDYDPRVINLVAHHSCAHIEARLRGLGDVLRREFPIDPDLPHDELCFCDMTTTPAGELTTVDQRLDEVLQRYGPGSIVYDAIVQGRGELTAAVQRVESQLSR